MEDWKYRLSTRLENALFPLGLTELEQVRDAIRTGLLAPGSPRNYGLTSHLKLCNLVGVTPVAKKRALNLPKEFIVAYLGTDHTGRASRRWKIKNEHEAKWVERIVDATLCIIRSEATSVQKELVKEMLNAQYS